jgi:uncharacterized membrane protein YdjX (TVP38/TMEM64 family)
VNRADRSSAELAQDIAHEAQDLIRLQIELLKQELRELAIRNGTAAGLLGFGVLLLMLAIFVALPVFLIMLSGNLVLGAAIWLTAYVVGGAILLLIGRLLLRLQPPQRTLNSLEETKAWALRQIRSNDR